MVLLDKDLLIMQWTCPLQRKPIAPVSTRQHLQDMVRLGRASIEIPQQSKRKESGRVALGVIRNISGATLLRISEFSSMCVDANVSVPPPGYCWYCNFGLVRKISVHGCSQVSVNSQSTFEWEGLYLCTKIEVCPSPNHDLRGKSCPDEARHAIKSSL